MGGGGQIQESSYRYSFWGGGADPGEQLYVPIMRGGGQLQESSYRYP